MYFSTDEEVAEEEEVEEEEEEEEAEEEEHVASRHTLWVSMYEGKEKVFLHVALAEGSARIVIELPRGRVIGKDQST